MDKKGSQPPSIVKAAFIGFVLFLISLLIFKIILKMGSLLSLLAGLVIGAISMIVLLAHSRGERPKAMAKEVMTQVQQPLQDTLTRRVEEQLLDLNLHARLESLPSELLQPLEETIDHMLEIVPACLAAAPGTETAFNLEKMSTDYFPDLVHKYTALSVTDQNLQKEKLLTQIADINKDVLAAKTALDQGKLNEFRISSDFIQAKTQ